MRNQNDRIELRIPARMDYLCTVRLFFEDLARCFGFPEKDVENIVMSVDEAVSNSINYSRREEEPLRITVSLTEDAMTITIEDAGDDFRERFRQNVEIEEHLREMREGGLGLHIMKTFMDAVDYKRTPHQTNHLTMVKFLR
jgi:anti-sigma regulatory factor (Ser/Thr protein kinase)